MENIDSLDALTKPDAVHEAASEAAAPEDESGDPLGIDVGEEIDRSGRDTVYVALREFMEELKGVARAAFRKQPDVLEQLRLTD